MCRLAALGFGFERAPAGRRRVPLPVPRQGGLRRAQLVLLICAGRRREAETADGHGDGIPLDADDPCRAIPHDANALDAHPGGAAELATHAELGVASLG